MVPVGSPGHFHAKLVAMKFKTVREAFEWMTTKDKRITAFDCWTTVTDYAEKMSCADTDDAALHQTLARALELCELCRISGNPPGARRDLEQFTDNDAEAALPAVVACWEDLERRSKLVAPVV